MCDIEPEVENCITVSTNGNCFDCFYHDYAIVPSTDVEVLYRKGITDVRERALYLCAVLRPFTKLYSYSNKPKNGKVFDTVIALPVIESSDPHHVYTPDDIDWAYMEDHIRRLEEDHIRRLEAYLRVAGFESTILTPEEQEVLRKFRTGGVIFRKCRICDLFEIKNTNSVMKNMITENSGKIPYITASDKNNAVLTYISCNKEWTDEGNCIFIGGKTMVITYQEEDFCSNDSHNLALYLKDRSMRRKRIQLFIISCLKKALSKKYTWGNSISRKKIDTEFVSLPCLPSGAPDYALMEVYIRALEKQAISRLNTMQKEEEKITKQITEER